MLTADECFGNACALLDTVYISPATADYKWTIVHEMGHALSVKADQRLPFAIFYEADPGICADAGPGSHFIISKEFQSAAASEGFAHLYAAITFNNEGESDCRMERSYSVDWDRSGPPSDGPQFSCTGSPDADAPSVDEKNYLQDWCDGSTYVRGTEYDWLRFFWGEIPATLDFDSLVEIWDLADPHHWCPTDAPTPFPHLPWEIPPPPAHLGPCYPSDRIMAAASLVLDPTFEFPFFAGHAEQHGVSTGFWAW
ncbi:hypothetical protein L6R50_11620 [Myxococcota bacterium]|nr:hypothetical protein [Myxococcota bacterium]